MSGYSLSDIRPSDSGAFLAEAKAPPDSPWFSGHFPGDPILPGIAQLLMVSDVIRLAMGRNVNISGVRKVRFRQIIRPDDPLKILVTPVREDPPTYSFKILMKEEIACSGVIITDSF